MLALVLPAEPAQAQFQLTKQQAADIDQVATKVQATLLASGKSAQDAQNARLAIRATMIAATYKTGDTQAADTFAGKVLDPYIKPAGSVARDLTAAEQAAVSNVRSSVKNLVAPVLPTPDADAVAFTAGLAATNTIKAAPPDPWAGSGLTADKWVASQADQDIYPLIVPFANLPPLTDPISPFRPAATLADDPAPQPSVSAAPPQTTVKDLQAAHPDATIVEQNGTAHVYQPNQDGILVEVDSGSVAEEGGSNQGNTKNRTGSDGGKKDEKNNSGGGNSNHNSGGHHK